MGSREMVIRASGLNETGWRDVIRGFISGSGQGGL